jgi:hypothetical protein
MGLAALETVSAALGNQHWRDNLLFLHDNRVSTRPTSALVDQDEVVFVGDATLRILWRLKYNSGGASGKKWEHIGGQPMIAHRAAPEGFPVATTYTTLGVQLTLPLGGDYRIEYGASVYTIANTDELYISPSIGATVASDAEAIHITTQLGGFSAQTNIVTVTAGNAIDLKSRHVTTDASYGSQHKFLHCWPIRVN